MKLGLTHVSVKPTDSSHIPTFSSAGNAGSGTRGPRRRGTPHLRSPAVARVQYCCVVLLRALVKADVFRLVVSKL